MRIKPILLAILFPFLTKPAPAQITARKHRVTEDEAMDTVMRLPEVKKESAYVIKVTKGKRRLFPLIYGEPTKDHPYWWVAVGEDNGMSFVTYYGFLVYVKTGNIYYYDTINGVHIDLQTWRKNGRKW